MSTVTSITVSFAAKVPTGAYANVDIAVTWQAVLDAGESPEDATADLYERVRREVTRAVAPIARTRARQFDDVLHRLPASVQDRLRVLAWLDRVLSDDELSAPATPSPAPSTDDHDREQEEHTEPELETA